MKFKDLLENEYGVVNEAGLSRVLQKLEDNLDFLIITAFRGSNTKKESQNKNNALIKDIRLDFNEKAGAYKLVGHWKECSIELKDNETISDCKGTITDTLEESWLIIRPDNVTTKTFFETAKKYVKKYKQDAFVIRIEGKLTLNGKDGEEWENLGKANKNSISQGFSRVINKQGYSELKKNRNKGRSTNIIFEGLYTKAPDDSISSKRIFRSANFLY